MKKTSTRSMRKRDSTSKSYIKKIIPCRVSLLPLKGIIQHNKTPTQSMAGLDKDGKSISTFLSIRKKILGRISSLRKKTIKAKKDRTKRIFLKNSPSEEFFFSPSAINESNNTSLTAVKDTSLNQCLLQVISLKRKNYDKILTQYNSKRICTLGEKIKLATDKKETVTRNSEGTCKTSNLKNKIKQVQVTGDETQMQVVSKAPIFHKHSTLTQAKPITSGIKTSSETVASKLISESNKTKKFAQNIHGNKGQKSLLLKNSVPDTPNSKAVGEITTSKSISVPVKSQKVNTNDGKIIQKAKDKNQKLTNTSVKANKDRKKVIPNKNSRPVQNPRGTHTCLPSNNVISIAKNKGNTPCLTGVEDSLKRKNSLNKEILTGKRICIRSEKINPANDSGVNKESVADDCKGTTKTQKLKTKIEKIKNIGVKAQMQTLSESQTSPKNLSLTSSKLRGSVIKTANETAAAKLISESGKTEEIVQNTHDSKVQRQDINKPEPLSKSLLLKKSEPDTSDSKTKGETKTTSRLPSKRKKVKRNAVKIVQKAKDKKQDPKMVTNKLMTIKSLVARGSFIVESTSGPNKTGKSKVQFDEITHTNGDGNKEQKENLGKVKPLSKNLYFDKSETSPSNSKTAVKVSTCISKPVKTKKVKEDNFKSKDSKYGTLGFKEPGCEADLELCGSDKPLSPNALAGEDSDSPIDLDSGFTLFSVDENFNELRASLTLATSYAKFERLFQKPTSGRSPSQGFRGWERFYV